MYFHCTWTFLLSNDISITTSFSRLRSTKVFCGLQVVVPSSHTSSNQTTPCLPATPSPFPFSSNCRLARGVMFLFHYKCYFDIIVVPRMWMAKNSARSSRYSLVARLVEVVDPPISLPKNHKSDGRFLYTT